MSLKLFYDVVIVGGGHNGLVSAAYLARSGVSVCVLEKRHILGGAATTQEIIPGFQFSRASYLLSLLRPHIYNDLELKKHGLQLFTRNPSSYTPLRPDKWKNQAKSLTLGPDQKSNYEQISKFSTKDAENYKKYEEYIENVVQLIDPVFDIAPHDIRTMFNKQVSPLEKIKLLYSNKHIRQYVYNIVTRKGDIKDVFTLLTSSAYNILNSWFESEPLIATLLTDGLIGAMISPNSPSTSYVLLHHVMGGVEGNKGAWAYPQGGMGAVSEALSKCALSHGAELFTNHGVKQILLNSNKEACGVLTEDNIEVKAKYVLSNATTKKTLIDLVPKGTLQDKEMRAVHSIDYTSPVTKINVALDTIPNFSSDPNRTTGSNHIMPHHQASVHINCEDTQQVVNAYKDGIQGKLCKRPMIEMVIPSSLDTTLCPPNKHVCLLFTQFTPYKIDNSRDWTQSDKDGYAKIVFDSIETYCPGFQSSIVGYEILTPPDLEKEFGLTGGNIFHGALSMEHLFFNRPLSNVSSDSPFTPVPKLLICGSGAHPGGGVSGAPGYIAATVVKQLLKK